MTQPDQPGPEQHGLEGFDPGAFLTTMGAAMTQMHEVYQSAVDAGFSEAQAMQIIVTMIASGIQAQK